MLFGHPSGAHPPSLQGARSVTTYKRPDTWLLCQNNLIVCVGCRIGISNNTHVMFAWSHLCCWAGLQRLGLAEECSSLRPCRFLQRFMSRLLIVSLLSMNLSTITWTLWNVPNGYVFLWQNQFSGRCVLNLSVILRNNNEFIANVVWCDSCLCKCVGACGDCQCFYRSAAGRDVCVWGEDWWHVLQVWWCIYVGFDAFPVLNTFPHTFGSFFVTDISYSYFERLYCCILVHVKCNFCIVVHVKCNWWWFSLRRI